MHFALEFVIIFQLLTATVIGCYFHPGTFCIDCCMIASGIAWQHKYASVLQHSRILSTAGSMSLDDWLDLLYAY